MKHRIAGWVARTPSLLRGLVSWTRTRPDRFVILTYHRVQDDGNPYFGGTPTRVFREQIRLVDECFDVQPLDELVKRATAGQVPPNAAAITFDDGYRDNYTHAFPVLRERHLPATIFLVTDALDENRLIWHDRVFDAMHRTSRDQVEFEELSLSLRTTPDRRQALGEILPRLRRLRPAERDARIDELVAGLGTGAATGAEWQKLSWDDVREMSAHGIRFGAHTLDHPIMSELDDDEARRQVRGSKARIEEQLDTSIAEFAYPNGRAADFTERTQRILREEGFRSAVTTVHGPNDGATDPLSLRRVGLWGDDPYLSVMRLARSRMSS